jgi:hypothetical protein
MTIDTQPQPEPSDYVQPPTVGPTDDVGDTLPSHAPQPPVPIEFPTWAAYAAIVAFGLACYGLILMTDYVIWDGWWYAHFIRNPGETHYLSRLLREIGRPQDMLFFLPFFLTTHIAFLAKVIGVIAWVVAAALQFRFLVSALSLSANTALIITLISVSCPFFPYCGELTYNMYVCAVLLFWAAWALVGARIARQVDGWPYRGLAAILFVASFELNSHIAHLYAVGAFVIAYRVLCGGGIPAREKLLAELVDFLRRYWELVALPVAYWVWKTTFTPTTGYYQDYNVVRLDPAAIGLGYLGFLFSAATNLPVTMLQAPGALVAAVIVAAVGSTIYRSQITGFFAGVSPPRPWWLATAAATLCLCSVFSYLAVGQPVAFTGWAARNTILLNLPFALLATAAASGLQRRFALHHPGLLAIPFAAIATIGLVACNLTTLRWQAFGLKQQAIQTALRDVIAQDRSAPDDVVNVINLRDYFIIPDTLDWYPPFVWTYLAAEDDEEPTVFVVETTRQIPDKLIQLPDGSTRTEVFPVQIGPAQLRELLEGTTEPYALTRIPSTGRTVTVTVTQGTLGSNGAAIGRDYLLRAWLDPGALPALRSSIVSVNVFD